MRKEGYETYSDRGGLRNPFTFQKLYAMGYDFVAKKMHRACLVSLYHENPTLPLLYLDGEDGEATTSFVHTWKIPKKYLIPVHWNSSVIRGIEEMNPGVKGRIGNIDHIVEEALDDSFSVVWLDYMCRYDGGIHTNVFRETIRVSHFASVTFSTRAIDKGDLTESLLRTIKKIGKTIESVTPYKGKSDVENMIKFTIGRSNAHETSDTDSDVSEEESVAHKAGDKVFVVYGGQYLTAVVEEVVDSSSILVHFDCDCVTQSVHPSRITPNKEDVDMTLHVGKEIATPIKIFHGDLHGYEATKQTKKNMFFKIGKRSGRTKRYTVNAVMKNGQVNPRTEKWTISPEQALCWIR